MDAAAQARGWAPVTYESRPWALSDGGHLSGRARRDHSGPYQAAVLPRIAGAEVNLPTRLLTQCSEAASELARFDEHLSGVLGEGVDGTGPLASVLLRTESASSSQIENITVGAREIALEAIGEHSSANAKLVAANVAATLAARDLGDDLSVETILAMHAALLGRADPDIAGRLRESQVWIGGTAHGPHRAAFVPPHHSRIAGDLDDLITFASRDDVPPLVLASLVHAQFETIHPFADGNGRTGRAIVHALLAGRGVTTRAVVPISAGLLVDTRAYFDALDAFRAGDAVPIVGRFARAAIDAAALGRGLVDDLARVRGEQAGQIRARKDAAVWRLNDLLVSQPVVNTGHVVDRLRVSVPTALAAIGTLEKVGVLVEATQKGRNRVWHAPAVVDVLDGFAARIRRAQSDA